MPTLSAIRKPAGTSRIRSDREKCQECPRKFSTSRGTPTHMHPMNSGPKRANRTWILARISGATVGSTLLLHVLPVLQELVLRRQAGPGSVYGAFQFRPFFDIQFPPLFHGQRDVVRLRDGDQELFATARRDTAETGPAPVLIIATPRRPCNAG